MENSEEPLLDGGKAIFKWHTPFGYVNALDFVGGQKTNNPAFGNAAYNSLPLLGTTPNYLTDDLITSTPRRSGFSVHTYAYVDNKVVDATMGPVTMADQRNVNDYLALVRDASTVAKQTFYNGDGALDDVAAAGTSRLIILRQVDRHGGYKNEERSHFRNQKGF